jgi:hypothetical protein
MLQIKSTKFVYRVFDLHIKSLLIVFAGLAGCQQLQVPFTPKTSTPNISWQELTIQRNRLPTSKTPNDDINAEAVELSVPVLTTNPEPNVPVMTVAPEIVNPQIFLDQSPDQLKNSLGAPSILRTEGNVEIWQYQFSDCVVDFFFYETAGKLAATYVDMRSPFLGDQLDHAACKYALYKISQ